MQKNAENFDLTEADLHNLYDLFYIINEDELTDVLELNKMDKWFKDFHRRMEEWMAHAYS